MPRHANTTTIPEAAYELNGQPRDVWLVDRIVGGNKRGAKVSELKAKYAPWLLQRNVMPPSPFHHWGVAVGDYLHQLQSTSMWSDGENWYDNRKWTEGVGWNWNKIGTTTFNDAALQSAGIDTINAMPEHYNIFNNNCQVFSRKMLELITRSGRTTVTPAHAIEQISAMEVYVPESKAELVSIEQSADVKEVEAAEVENPEAMKELLDTAQSIMDENTPTLNKDTVPEDAKKPEVSAVEMRSEVVQ